VKLLLEKRGEIISLLPKEKQKNKDETFFSFLEKEKQKN
jgi:hypothetical protein